MPDYDPNSLEAVLARMESRQIVNTDRLNEILTRLDRHEERIQFLEQFKWKLLGALTLGSAGGAAAFTKLFN
jgi:hypothetical protein